MNDVQDDPIAMAVATVLRDLVEGEGKNGWDQPPSLWIIVRSRLVMSETQLTVPLTLVKMDTGPLFSDGEPADQLAWLARRVASGAFKQPPDSEEGQAIGFVFLTEAWALSAPRQGFTDAMLEATRNRKIKELPERIEVRIASAVDTSGIIYGLMVPRDPTKTDVMETFGRPGEETRNHTVIAGGYVIDSLTTLVESIA